MKISTKIEFTDDEKKVLKDLSNIFNDSCYYTGCEDCILKKYCKLNLPDALYELSELSNN